QHPPTSPLFPYTTLFRSRIDHEVGVLDRRIAIPDAARAPKVGNPRFGADASPGKDDRSRSADEQVDELIELSHDCHDSIPERTRSEERRVGKGCRQRMER